MLNTKFEAYKIKREIEQSGRSFLVYRRKKNDYGEPSGKHFFVGGFNGLYHEVNTNLTGLGSGSSNNSTFRPRKQPAILCLLDDIKQIGVETNDFVLLNEKTFKVDIAKDIQELGIVCDLILEEVIENVVQA